MRLMGSPPRRSGRGPAARTAPISRPSDMSNAMATPNVSQPVSVCQGSAAAARPQSSHAKPVAATRRPLTTTAIGTAAATMTGAPRPRALGGPRQEDRKRAEREQRPQSAARLGNLERRGRQAQQVAVAHDRHAARRQRRLADAGRHGLQRQREGGHHERGRRDGQQQKRERRGHHASGRRSRIGRRDRAGQHDHRGDAG